MENELIFDIIIKEKSKNKKLILPMDLDKKLLDTISSLPERNIKKNTFVKKIIAAALIVLARMTGLSITYPVLGLNLPVVNSVFQFLSKKLANSYDAQDVINTRGLN